MSESVSRPRLTKRSLFVIAAMNLIDCINANILAPYAVEMVSSFLNRGPETVQVHTTVTLLIGIYSLFEVIFAPFWGMLADRLGRRPCLLIGLAGSTVAPVLMGFSTSLPMAFAARALDGFFCGNLGVTRTYLGELVDKSTEARGFSILGLGFAMGLVIGPVLGGQLVFPARTAPEIFGNTIFDSYPFLLPNLTYACFAAVAWVIGYMGLEETLRSSLGEALQEPQRQGTRSCYPAATLQVIFCYCGLAGTAIAQNSLVILLLPEPRSHDGFDFSPREISWILNTGALGVILCQLFLYPKLTKQFGFLNTFILGFILNTVAYGLYPAYGLLADPSYGLWRYLALGLGQFVNMMGTFLMFPTAFSFINRASQGLKRATVQGFANSSGALSRALAPSLAALLLDSCREWGWFGRYIPFYIISFLCGLFLLASWSGMRKVDGEIVNYEESD